MAHRPAVALKKQAVEASCGNRNDVAGHNLLWDADIVGFAVTQFALKIHTHAPQAAVTFEKQAVFLSDSNLGNRLRAAGGRL
jgi:hypothetical protein